MRFTEDSLHMGKLQVKLAKYKIYRKSLREKTRILYLASFTWVGLKGKKE